MRHVVALFLTVTVAVGWAPVATASGAVTETTLEKIRRTGVLVIGTRTSSAPLAYINRSTEWVGFSIDLVEEGVLPAVSRKIGKPVKLEKESRPATRVTLLLTRNVDLIAGTMTDTYAALTRSPCSASVARAASSAFARPTQVARDGRNLGFRDDAPRAGHGLFHTECTRSTSQEGLRSNEIAELRHRDASKRESRRVVAQGDPLQCAEGVARRECTRRGSDQRVHRNPVTPVTPTVTKPGAKSIS
jgi:Bacterial extracellular solute-binding proteins, family 3